MIVSLAIGFLFFISILLSGWLRVLFSFISISFGSRIPFLYFFLGTSFGYGSYFHKTQYWPGFILCMTLTILLVLRASKMTENQENFSTVSTCGSGFLIASLIGLISSFIF
jgi:hypothetical protein